MATRPDLDIEVLPEKEKPQGWVKSVAASHDEVTKKSTSSRMMNPAKKALSSMMKIFFKSHRGLRILVTGKTGQGKSTLINGLLGIKDAREGAGHTRCTTEVQMYSKTIEGVSIKVFDSPGLQDSTNNEEEYIRDMKKQCHDLSLVLYCTKMTNTRLTDDDKNAMIKLTKAFGEHIWDYAVFVLTFANKEDVSRQDERDEDKEEPDNDDEEGWKILEKRRFEGRIKFWIKGLQEFLIKEVGVSPDIATNIPVVPTGDRKKTRQNKEPLRLPDRENWFTTFWEACCLRVKETGLFLKVNSGRIVDNGEEFKTEDDDIDEEKDSGVETGHSSFEATLQTFKELEKQETISVTVESLEDFPEPRLRSKTESDLSKEVVRRAKRTETEAGVPPIPLGALRPQPPPKPPRQRASMYVSSKDAPQQWEPFPPANLRQSTTSIHLDEQNITMNPAFVGDVTAETLRRAGLGERLIKYAKSIVARIKNPANWIMGISQSD